jgi:hypothetical protein
MSLPSAPTDISVSGSQVSFINTDTSVTNYEYSLDNGVVWVTLGTAESVSPLNFSFLSLGTYSCIMIRSVNSVGYSDPVNAINVIVSPPSAPYIISVNSQYVFFGNDDTSVVNYQFRAGSDPWYDYFPAQTTSPLDFSFFLFNPDIVIRSVNSAGHTSYAVNVTPNIRVFHPRTSSLTSSGTSVTAVSLWTNLSGFQWSTTPQWATNAFSASFPVWIPEYGDHYYNMSPTATWTSIPAGAQGTACTFIPTGLVSGNNTIYVRPMLPGMPGMPDVPGFPTAITINYSPPMASIANGGSHVVSGVSTAHSVIAHTDATLVAGGFMHNTIIHTVDLSATSINHVPSLTFKGCTSLANVILPPLANRVEASSFTGCVALSAITIPSSVSNIGIQSFEGSGLVSITLTGPTTVESHAFAKCTFMTTATV